MRHSNLAIATAAALAATAYTDPRLQNLSSDWNAIAAGNYADVPNRYADTALQFAENQPNADAALNFVGAQFRANAYPNFDTLRNTLGQTNAFAMTVIDAVETVYREFGHNLPACCYTAMLAALDANGNSDMLNLWQERDRIDFDRAVDAGLHALALNTPVFMRVQSILSAFGLEIMHTGKCGCCISPSNGTPFNYTLPDDLRANTLDCLVRTLLDEYHGILGKSMTAKVH